MTLDGTQTVGEIAREYPASVPVFEALGIDYCCGGNRSLEDACRKKDVSLNLVLSDLSGALITRPTEDERHWMTSSLADLADHIVCEHHAYSKRELPRLTVLASKVRAKHGHMHTELHKICALVEAMAAEMSMHMLKEEQLLFPRLKIVEEAACAKTAPPPAFFGPLINPIRHMMGDHDDTGELLKSLRELTRDYTPPQNACMSFQALYHGLAALEKDLHQHVHLENNILFPRALDLERAQ